MKANIKNIVLLLVVLAVIILAVSWFTNAFKDEEKFEYDKTETYATEHYVFHYQKGSLAEKEIQTISETQEVELYGLKPSSKYSI